jgi:hypothetical protein
MTIADLQIGHEEYQCSQRLLKELRKMDLYQGSLTINLDNITNELVRVIGYHLLDDLNEDERKLKQHIIRFLDGDLVFL